MDKTEPENWYTRYTSWDADVMIAALLLPGVPKSVPQSRQWYMHIDADDSIVEYQWNTTVE
jgi:hypothetical protein